MDLSNAREKKQAFLSLGLCTLNYPLASCVVLNPDSFILVEGCIQCSSSQRIKQLQGTSRLIATQSRHSGVPDHRVWTKETAVLGVAHIWANLFAVGKALIWRLQLPLAIFKCPQSSTAFHSLALSSDLARSLILILTSANIYPQGRYRCFKSHIKIMGLEKWSIHIFCEGPENLYFQVRMCGPWCKRQQCCHSNKATTNNVNKWPWPCASES